MGLIAKVAEEVGDNWEKTISAQKEKLRTKIPLSEDEAALKAQENLRKLREKAYGLGYLLRQMARQSSEPSDLSELGPREMVVGIPAINKSAAWLAPHLLSKQADLSDAIFSAVIDPLRYGAQDLKESLLGSYDKAVGKGMQTTTRPETLPWYYPTAALSAPKQFAKGYSDADKTMDEQQSSEVDSKVEAAKQDFEQALQEEYASSKQAEATNAGQMIDRMAQIHVKAAEGELGEAAGLYLALASLLGAGAYNVGKLWTEGKDPRYQKYKAIEEGLRRRTRSKPLPITAGVDPSTALEVSKNVSEQDLSEVS